jgi:hypothetical protein
MANSLTVAQKPDFPLHNTLPMNLLIMQGTQLTGLMWNVVRCWLEGSLQQQTLSGALTAGRGLQLQINVWKCRKLSTTRYSTVVTICTASGHYMYCQWSLYVPNNGHYMYRQWSLYVPHSGHYMYRQFNIHQFYVLPTQSIYVFCVDLRTNSDYFTRKY